MPEYTDNLKLFKYNTETDGKEVFSINEAMNYNWDILDKQTGTFEIGHPIMALSNALGEKEIWLEGAIVSRTTYTELFAIYGTTYGEGDGSATFQLPDFRGKVPWGSADGTFGYIEAGLPNITSNATGFGVGNTLNWANGGATSVNYSLEAERINGGNHSGRPILFNASRSSSVYGKSNTVQPPSFKVRWKTRYK